MAKAIRIRRSLLLGAFALCAGASGERYLLPDDAARIVKQAEDSKVLAP